MMKIRFFLSLIPLIILRTSLVLLLVAAPSASPGMAETNPTQIAGGTAPTLSPTPLPIATSRGPHLHATNPTTVNLASGGLHLIEFFRFT